MAVYLDLVVLLNFLVDFLLLQGTNRLSGFPANPWRCAGAATVGSVYAAACMMPGFRFLGNLLWRAVCLMLIGVLAFGLNRSALRRGAVFLMLSMALGGLALSIGRNDFPALITAAALCFFLCRLSFGSRIGGREYAAVRLRHAGQEVSVIALRDTGNTLRDPITGEQVLVVSGEIGQKLTGLTMAQLAAPLDTLTRMPIPGLRLIPYRTVGNPGGMLLGLRMEDVHIDGKRNPAVVAFAPEGLGRETMVQALTGGVI